MSTLELKVSDTVDSDGDRIPDDYELANGLDPGNPADANEDFDQDGITNLNEYEAGTNPNNADTDGDGLSDGQETTFGTDPLVFDNTTQVVGTVLGSFGNPIPDADVTIFGIFSAVSQSDGTFSMPVVPTSLGSLVVLAEKVINGKQVSGTSGAALPVANGVTNVGNITLSTIESVDFATSRKDTPVGTRPEAFASGDVDNDGDKDVAVVDYTDKTLWILINNNGKFDSLPPMPIGASASAIKLADFNQDGNLDAITNNESGVDLRLMIGQGDGTFGSPASIPLSGAYAGQLEVSDFNGDLLDDVVVTVQNQNSVIVLLGNGNGTFGSPLVNAAGSLPYALAVSDLNHDNHPDIVSSDDSGRGITILLGLGDGSFGPALSVNTDGTPHSIGLADFDSDGNVDLAMVMDSQADFNLRITIFKGAGDGSFSFDQSFSQSLYDLIIADFDLDGKADIAARDFRNLLIWIGDGLGQFTPTGELVGGDGFRAVLVDDFNNDGLVDIGMINENSIGISGSFSLYVRNLDGSYGLNNTFSLNQNTGSIIAEDVNNDLKLDLLAADGNVRLYVGDGLGVFSSLPTPYLGFANSDLVAGDFNNDGLTDVAASTPADDVYVLLGTGGGSFVVGYSVSGGLIGWSVNTGDFDLDGRLDLVVTNSEDDTVSVFLRDSLGNFIPAPDLLTGDYPRDIAVGDLNGDHIPDLGVANRDSNTVSIFLCNGDGTFTAEPDIVLESGVLPRYTFSVVMEDFNRDGAMDLAIAQGFAFDRSKLEIHLGDGDGTFGSPIELSVDAYPENITTGDFNRDGYLDLVTANAISNTVSVLLGSGDGTFEPALNFPVENGPNSIAVGDFNGDLLDDIAVVNSSSDNISILFNISQ